MIVFFKNLYYTKVCILFFTEKPLKKFFLTVSFC